jgi:putative peptidoglycan lipid II flippase
MTDKTPQSLVITDCATGPRAERPPIRKVAAFLMSGALLSKLIGLVREIIMAQLIGVAAVADSFRASVSIILLPLAFLQNESVPAILIPRMQEAQRVGKAPACLTSMTLALAGMGAVIMFLTMAGASLLVQAIIGGLSSTEQALTTQFVIVMSLSMPASVMINCLAAGEIVLGKTRLMNARASILNVGIILGLGMLAMTGYALALAWAFTLAFNVLAVWGIWMLWREGNLSFAGLSWSAVKTEAIEFLRRLRPFLLLPAAEQGNIWVERFLASRLATGAIASLDYARALTDSTLLLVSQPIGLAILSDGSQRSIAAQAEKLTRLVLVIAVPAAAFFFVFAQDVVRLVFHRGAFGETGVLLTSEILRGISVGLWASTLGWILLRLLNSSGRSTTAALILVSAFVSNAAINLATSGLHHSAGTGMLLLGLGETSRSLVLLLGVILALPNRMRLLGIVAISALPAALMVGIGWQVALLVENTFARLIAGGLVFAVCTLLGAALLIPDVRDKGIRSVLGRLKG